MNGIISTDYGFTPPPLSTVPIPPTTEKPKPTTMALTAWHVQQQPASSQSFESIATLSLAQAPALLPSPTFPAFPRPVITLTLPNPKVLTPTPDPVPKPSSTSKALHILAVDDNALNLNLLHRYLLKREGDIIVTAKNGVEAVEAVKSRKKGFDVIFMDISMPEMDGFEATRFIRGFENTRSLQLGEDEKVSMEKGKEKRAYIVALTGLASRRDRDLAEECGFDDFLTKPISFKRIGELLRGLGEKGS
jgi:CheY-like chemotaxis protein